MRLDLGIMRLRVLVGMIRAIFVATVYLGGRVGIWHNYLILVASVALGVRGCGCDCREIYTSGEK